MSRTIRDSVQPMLDAVAFAARAHRHQLRKDDRTPYVSHVFRVCLVVRDVFGIDDRKVLTCAALHDTIEDTTTDFNDIAKHFGPEIATWVGLLSKDTRMPDAPREAAYNAQLASAPWQVKVAKLADVFDNLMDSATLPAERRPRTLKNARHYLDALKPNLPEQARRPWEMTAALLAEIETAP